MKLSLWITAVLIAVGTAYSIYDFKFKEQRIENEGPCISCRPPGPAGTLLTIYNNIRTPTVRAWLDNRKGSQDTDVIARFDFSLPFLGYQFPIDRPDSIRISRHAFYDDAKLRHYFGKARDFEPIFTMSNNISVSKTDAPDLLVILPNIYKHVCLDIQEQADQKYIPVIDRIDLTELPEKSDTINMMNVNGEMGCVQIGRTYHFYGQLLAF